MIQEWFQHTSFSSHESNQLVDDISELYIDNHPPLGLDLYEESKDLKIVEMASFSFLDMDHNQYDDSDELNVYMPMSISHEIQSLTDHEVDRFSIKDSFKVQESSSNHNIEPSSSSIIKELQDFDIHFSVNPLIDLESTNCSEICDMFSQLPFSNLSNFVGEHISQNDDTALQ